MARFAQLSVALDLTEDNLSRVINRAMVGIEGALEGGPGSPAS